MLPWILVVFILTENPYGMSLEYKQEFPNHAACIAEIPKYQHEDKMVICALKREDIKE